MKLHIEHETHYHYEGEVATSIQYLRLTPQVTAQQKVIDWHLDLPGAANEVMDGFGNVLTVLVLDLPLSEITIHASGTVDLSHKPVCDHASALAPEVFLRQTELTETDAELRRFAQEHKANAEGLAGLMHSLLQEVRYTPGATTASHTAQEAFRQRAGVCQDHTHIFLGCCRHLGVPARYVSGYLHTDQQPHVASHAWAEAWLNDGWHTFDVANGLTTPDAHIKLAVGMDYLDAAPVRGIRSGGGIESMTARAVVSEMAQVQ